MRLTPLFLLIGLLALGAAGCNSLFGGSEAVGADPEGELYDAELYSDLDLDLEDPSGGYGAEDEEPGFGEPNFFRHRFELAVAAGDGQCMSPEIRAMLATPGVQVHYLYLSWGQLAGNPDIDTATDWSGSIRVDRGGIVVLRRIAFERLTDWVVFPREDVKVVDLHSLTTTHYDGLLLQVIDPDPAAPEANALTIAMGPAAFSVPVADLDGYESLLDVDALGNQMSLQAPAILDCPNGFLMGIWVHRPGEAAMRGIFRGAFLSYEGELLGHLRGHWGVTDEGEQLFRGKWIARDGSFRGFLRGTWTADPAGSGGHGSFAGDWIDETETLMGTLAGHYRSGPGRGGFFAGRWLDAGCAP